MATLLAVSSPWLGQSPFSGVGAVLAATAWWNGWSLLGVLATVALAVLLYAWLRPGAAVRLFVWLVTHTLYRIRIHGAANVPVAGGALLVCNHVSFIDWLLLMGAQRRTIRFIVFAGYARRRFFRHFLRWAGAIPIDGSGGPKAIVQALRSASHALNRGELVCIFAEGALTRTGFLLPFHRAFEHVLRRSRVPVVPVCLDQVWGSVFSFHGGRALWKWPQELPYPVTVAYGQPLPSTCKAAEVRLAIQKLSADCAVERNHRRLPVHRRFVRVACRHPFRPCLIDPNARNTILSYGMTLAGSICLARHLRPILGDSQMVGVWLPSSTAGAITNITLALLGKTSVNLNYTSSAEFVQSAKRQCSLRHIVTSRRFVGRIPLTAGPDVETIYLEDFAQKVTTAQRIAVYLIVVLLPGWLLDRWLGLHKHSLDDLATVIFSSGSTGEPKGVMLTHGNVTANTGSMVQAIDLRPRDRALAALPFFHSFGYTVTLWVPLQMGASLVYYPDPRQAKEIGELCKRHGCTIYLATPTFLRLSLRRSEPEDFRSLRLLVCGAEKMAPALAKEFEARFGVLPLEGYGCTELSPVVSVNLPDVEIRGVRQVGNKPGTIGQPLPGIAVRVANPETFEPLPPGEEGMLLIYGANVMKGYLGQEERTRDVIRDGWYVTGDMARIDEDGFVAITGRLSRFAKIGGEMVPLQRIEEELHGLMQTNDQVCAVTAVPDEKKGERVVVLHLPLADTNPRRLSEQLMACGLPSLGLPGERDFYQVAEMPVLGSGKLDLKRVKDVALEKVRSNGR